MIKTRTTYFTKILTTLFITYLFLRLFSFGDLLNEVGSDFIRKLQVFSVGAMSDLWVSFLWAMVFLFISFVVMDLKRLYYFFVVGMAVVCSMHLSYMNYFGHPIHPFHLAYLFDYDFVTSNRASLFALKPLGLLMLSLAVGVLVHRARFPKFTTRGVIFWPALMALMLLAHNRNIHYRVQWFIPDAMQVNGFEHLYLKHQLLKVPPALAANQWEMLLRGASPEEREDFSLLKTEKQKVAFILGRRARVVTKKLQAIKEALAARSNSTASNSTASNSTKAVIVYLMESQRPAEGLALSASETLTPTLHALASSGVVFENAYASGNVTRSAQEAILCGYPSGFATSTMRGQAEVKIDCLPALAAGETAHKFLWIHGGDPGFDNQLAYWQKQGFDEIYTRDSFPASVEQTGWGVSDIALSSFAAEKVVKNLEQGHLFSFVLSATNHIPWDLPKDGPAERGRDSHESYAHKSYATTVYADAALANFVQELKSAGIWQRVVLIVASDHGNMVAPFAADYDAGPQKVRLTNHVQLVLSGGVSERLRQSGVLSARESHVVTLADVGVSLAHMLNLELAENFFGTDLFSNQNSDFKFAHTGWGIYIPSTNAIVKDAKTVSLEQISQMNDPRAALYYAAFLRFGYLASFR